jgi:hypothetical protein
MTCAHTKTTWIEGYIDTWTGEQEEGHPEEVFTFEDIDTGRYRCTQCGLVMYYTGNWKAHHEGTPK